VASGKADQVFGSDDPVVAQLIAGELSGPIQLSST
jgi:hypothetical protein